MNKWYGNYQGTKKGKQGRLHSVKTGFHQIFAHEGLAAKVEQAVLLATPIFTEGSLLANLHVLRCIESGQHAPVLSQDFFFNCYSAVSHSMGNGAQQFKPANHPSLAASYNLYPQCLPNNHARPERPTFIKDVSTACTDSTKGWYFVDHECCCSTGLHKLPEPCCHQLFSKNHPLDQAATQTGSLLWSTAT